jgi:hypothetical protein
VGDVSAIDERQSELNLLNVRSAGAQQDMTRIDDTR